MDEPILMQNQEGAFNCDTFVQKEIIKLSKKFNLKIAVETGTCLGYTAEWLADHFDYVGTVEVNERYYQIARVNRLNNKSNVMTYLGSSTQKLPMMLEQLNDNTFIFLDAHWEQDCPLERELDAIAAAGIKPVIAIHDFQVPDHPELGFDSIGDQPFTFEWLKPKFDKIYGEGQYTHYYNSEAEGAKRGVIYLHKN